MKEKNFNIVLVHPQIPNNTGNIGRLCVGSQSKLHLVKPLGFEITDARVKRAGLDYWDDLDLSYYDDMEALIQSVPDMSRMFFFTTRASCDYYDIQFEKGDWLIFGRESDGLPPELVQRFSNQCVKIPFPGKVRSFNLSNAVAMALGEGLRQFR
jgi:tRNA (cytidine/uridine-2'-O-)-methyltransferase